METWLWTLLPLDRDAIVKPTDKNRFWLIANVSVKIKGRLRHTREEIVAVIFINVSALSENMLESCDSTIECTIIWKSGYSDLKDYLKFKLLHFEHKNDVTIIAKYLYRGRVAI